MTKEEIEAQCKVFAADNGLDHEVKDYYPPLQGPDGEYLDAHSLLADGITIAFETRIAGPRQRRNETPTPTHRTPTQAACSSKGVESSTQEASARSHVWQSQDV